MSYLEALSASGLRSIRVAKETVGLSRIVANDMEPIAVEQIQRNFRLNHLPSGDGPLVEATCNDAIDLMYAHRKGPSRFDVVDIDPYGSPTLFVDGAVQCVADNGLLQVTATDLMNLCGGQAEVCFRKYGSVGAKSRAAHEAAVRIVVGQLALRAQAYGRGIHPVACVMADFYVRCMVTMEEGGAAAQKTATRIGHAWQCPQCHTHATQTYCTTVKGGQKVTVSGGAPLPPSCPHCGSTVKMFGPMWLGPLHDPEALDAVIAIVEDESKSFASRKKLLGMLSMAREELSDVPLFYNLSDLCNVIRSTCPSMHAFRSAIMHQGYRISGVHTEPFGFKTDAPADVIWDVLRCWKKNSGKAKEQKATTPAFKIMSVEPKFEANFTLLEEAATSKKRPRFIKVQGWGPKSRAITGSANSKTTTQSDVAQEEGQANPLESDLKKTKTE